MNTLLEVYLSEVSRRLPLRNRRDIEAEMRSTLQDMLEERAKAGNKPVDEALTLAVLKEYGSPEHVAASYAPERSLVGPRLYPLFMLVLKIVLTVITVIAIVSWGIRLGQDGMTLASSAKAALHVLGDLFTSAMTVVGNLVLVFAILQRFLPEFKLDFKDDPEKWDPASLKEIAPAQRVSVVETIIEIVGASIAIVLFNFYPQIFQYTPSLNGALEGGVVVILPVLSEAFFRYVPYLTALWGLTIVLDVILLQQGAWKPATRWALIGLKIGAIAMAAVMLAGPSIIAVTQASLNAAISDPETASILYTMLTTGVKVALWLAILGGTIDVGKSVVNLVKLYAQGGRA